MPLQQLPPELLAKIAEHVGHDFLSTQPQYLTLWRSWFDIAVAVRYERLQVSPKTLQRWVDADGVVLPVLEKVLPLVRTLVLSMTADSELWDARDRFSTIGMFITGSARGDSRAGCHFSRAQVQKHPFTSLHEAITRLRSRCDDGKETMNGKKTKFRLKHIEIVMFDQGGGCMCGWSPVDWPHCIWMQPLTRLIDMDCMTSLYFDINGRIDHRIQGQRKKTAHMCWLINDRLQNLRSLFITMNTMCEDLLRIPVQPVESLEKIVVYMGRQNRGRFGQYHAKSCGWPADGEGKGGSYIIRMCEAAKKFANSMQNLEVCSVAFLSDHRTNEVTLPVSLVAYNARSDNRRIIPVPGLHRVRGNRYQDSVWKRGSALALQMIRDDPLLEQDAASDVPKEAELMTLGLDATDQESMGINFSDFSPLL